MTRRLRLFVGLISVLVLLTTGAGGVLARPGATPTSPAPAAQADGTPTIKSPAQIPTADKSALVDKNCPLPTSPRWASAQNGGSAAGHTAPISSSDLPSVFNSGAAQSASPASAEASPRCSASGVQRSVIESIHDATSARIAAGTEIIRSPSRKPATALSKTIRQPVVKSFPTSFPPRATAATTYIKGTVTDDAETPNPLNGITVYLVDETDYPIDTVPTNASGYYQFAVDPGTYYLYFYGDPTYASGYWGHLGLAYYFDDAETLTVAATDVTADMALPAAVHIEGTLSGSGTLSGVTVTAVNLNGDPVSNDLTDAGGSYSMVVPPGSYFVYANDSDDRYGDVFWSSGGPVYGLDNAEMVAVLDTDVTADMTLPDALFIKGTLSPAAGGSLANPVDVDIYSPAWEYLGTVYTDTDDAYSMKVPPGDYYVGFYDEYGTYAIGYWSESGFVFYDTDADPVSIVSADATANAVLPAAILITGRVTGSGATIHDEIVVVADSVNGSFSTPIDPSDGTYELPVAPGAGYLLYFEDYDDNPVWASGYYSTSGFTYDYRSATLVNVASSNVTGKNVTLPKAVHIKGKVTHAGLGVGNVTVRAELIDGSDRYVAQTDGAGNFSVVVRSGTFTLRFSSATYAGGYWSSSGFTYYLAKATAIAVGSSDVTGRNVVLPDARFITGTVLNGSSDPVGGTHVVAIQQDGGDVVDTYADDTDGTYALPVAPGTYTVYFGAPGGSTYGGSYGSGYYASGASGHFTYDSTAATELAVSTANVTANVTLPVGLRIIGTVTRSGGVGLEGIDVTIVTSSGRTWDYTTTDADGHYAVVVPPGTYKAAFYDPEAVYASGYYGSTGLKWTLTDATSIGVSSGDHANVDVELPLANHLSGGVWAAGGGTLAGVDVYVFDAEGYLYDITTTGLGGAYSVAVGPGSYTVSFSDTAGTYAPGWYNSGGTGNYVFGYWNAEPISVTSTDVTGINVTMPLAVHISGKVTRSGGQAISNIGVRASGASGTYTDVTALDGTYSMAVAPGNYTLYFMDDAGTYASGYLGASGFVYGSSSAATIPVTSNVTGKNITLPVALHIKGKVSRAGGGSVPDATVQAIGTIYGGTTTYADGTFSVPVAPGTYQLWFADNAMVYASGYWSSAGFTYYRSGATTITVSTADSTGKNVTLPKALWIKGRVTDESNVPLTEIAVYAANSQFQNQAFTDLDGSYWIEVPPGTFTLSYYDPAQVYASGYYGGSDFTYYAANAASLTLSSASLSGKNVHLPTARFINGTITDGSATPLPNIEVDISRSDGLYANGTYADENGKYSVEVAPGAYTAWFSDRTGTNGRGYWTDTNTLGYEYEDADPITVGATSVTADVSMTAAGYMAFPAATYHAIDPRRVLDTRPTGSGHTNIGLTGTFNKDVTRTFSIAAVRYVGGTGPAIPLNSVAVTGNLTIVNQTADGYVTLGPTIAVSGSTTTINFAKGDIRANNVTIGLAPGGYLQAVYRTSTVGATMDLIFDITGYFLPNSMGATYHPVAPGRVLDSRPTGSGVTNIGLKGKFGNRVVRTFTVAGVVPVGGTTALVPANATAVSGNLTVTKATSPGYVAVGPTMTSSPSTSTINTVAGSNRANGVIVALKAGKLQAVWAGASGSTADVIFDVTGYFTADATGYAYHPVEPVRVLDQSAGYFTDRVSSSHSIVAGHVSASAAGISGNVTVVNPSSNGYAFISPSTVASPTSSTVNINAHQTVANGVNVASSSGNVALIWVGTTGSQTYMQLDVTGYWK